MVVSEPLKIDPASFSELKCPFQRMSGKETISLFILHCIYTDDGSGEDVTFRVNTKNPSSCLTKIQAICCIHNSKGME